MVNKFLFLAAFLISASAAAQAVKPSLDLTEMRVEIHWLESQSQIRRQASEYGKAMGRPLGSSRTNAGRHQGFSVLVKIGSEYVCRIYAMRPEKVDDRATTSLGHELMHCALGNYHPS